MAEYPIEKFTREIEALPIEDERDLLTFIGWSARLAALPNGDDHLLKQWPALVARERQNKIDLSTALRNRCKEGLWDLQYAIGEDLGLAMIAAQDFYCFWKRDKNLLEGAVSSDLEAWFAEAEETLQDEETADTLRTFIERFPLLPEFRLSAVDTPVSTLMAAVFASMYEPRKTIPAVWVPRVLIGDKAPEEMSIHNYADAGAGPPTIRLMRRMDRQAIAPIPGLGNVLVARSLTEDWQLWVDVEQDQRPSPVRAVRLGLLPARPSEDGSTSGWQVDLKHFSLQEKLDALSAPVAVSFMNGDRMRISDKT